MKNATLQAMLLLLALAASHSRAGDPQTLPDYLKSGSARAVAGETPEPLRHRLVDFRKRLEAAVESRDLLLIQALYQTNGMPLRT
ncbi:MAG: hypothetical protein NT154_40470 [Verrucomicrobia bacterium]|nr:hypothetical protein [Verrucomicrobiota bacterium]